MAVVWSALGLCLLPNIGGIFAGFYTRKNIKTWYKTLKRPDWNPPDWVFGPVWTTLYTSMGYASYLVWRDSTNATIEWPLALYGSQLLLNWAWTPIFFGMKNLKMAYYEILLLYGNAAACGLAFYSVNKTAGLIFIPYMAWLTLATALTHRIWKDNPSV